jgi:hypothetical protein
MLVTRPALRWAAALTLAAALTGCSPGDGPFPVEGTVVWEDDGTPAKELHLGSVIFDLPERQIGARGVIQPDGTFRLTTTKPGDGAMVGDYKVVILEGARKPIGDGTVLAPLRMDARYSDRNATDLTATVKPGKNVITLKVKRAARK